MQPITLTRDQLLDLAEQAIDLYLEYRDQHGYRHDQARASAVLEVVEGMTAEPPTPDEVVTGDVDRADWPL